MSHIPSSIDTVYQELSTEVSWLHAKWMIYRQLFAHSEKRVRLLNECASEFFYVIQEMLYAEVLLALSRLTDPEQTFGHDNLSLERLRRLIEAQGETMLASDLRKRLDDIKSKCDVFRRHRDKRLAHIDLITRTQRSADPLPATSRQMIEEALGAVREYMNAIQRHYCNSETGYQYFRLHSGGDALVYLMKRGLRYQALVREGVISWADWEESAWRDA